MELPVRAEKISGIHTSLAEHVRRAAAGFFDDDAERREVPRLRGPIEGRVDGPLCDQHVLPESADGTAITRGIGETANAFPRFLAFAGAGAGGEHHRFA